MADRASGAQSRSFYRICRTGIFTGDEYRGWNSACILPLKGNVTAVLFMPFVDETIQLFVEGRSGQISDVWLDMAGIVTGIMVTAGFMKMTGALKTGRKAAKGKGSGNRSRNNEL